MLLVIDNYDSFTYNLVQYLGELRQDVRVVRNDEIPAAAIARNHSMWQLASDATNASSGSTAAASDIGSGTELGADEPGTSRPPSKRSRCLRL